MIRVYHWNCASKTVHNTGIDSLPSTIAQLPEGDTVWIDLANPTTEEEDRILGWFLVVHPLTLEDITKPRRMPKEGAHLAKVEEFDNYLFVIVNPLPWEACHPDQCAVTENPGERRIGWRRRQLSAVLSTNVLITHHYDPLSCVESLYGYVDRRTENFHRGPDYVFHLILDAMVDEYAPVVERFGSRLSRIESELFQNPSRHLLTKLLRLKRRVLFLRKTLVLEREVLARLVRAEFDLVNENEIHYYRNVYDHLVRYTELIEGAREMVSDLMQLHLAATSNKLNEVMKVLTMISIMVGGPTLIAGIYGMNFKQMPELEWNYGYPLALGLMVTVSSLAFAWFRWRKWV
ncbi:magnesium/cobalt transporter CorA [soil metagenome]